MGERIEFPSNGTSGQGYLATPQAGAGPGVVVVQEWWGLVPHIEDVCDRFAAEGFCALAPDLYGGKATTEPDEAMKLMMAMDMGRAAKDLAGAARLLQSHELVRGDGVGVIGFCMGGGLALLLASQQPDLVRAAVPFYGVIPGPVTPDWSAMQAAVQGHYAEHDDFASPEKAAALEAELRGLGKEAELFVYPGTHHAFFNDTRAEVYDEDAARTAWVRTLEFLRAKLG